MTQTPFLLYGKSKESARDVSKFTNAENRNGRPLSREEAARLRLPRVSNAQ
jgi:hypothetical protein